jgi:hypothetical protein
MATSETAVNGPDPSALLLAHCRRILEQNLLTAGETFVLATPMVYDVDYMQAMLVAASEIGATGMQVAVISHPPHEDEDLGNLGAPPGYALTAVHWDLYAQADLLITTRLGATPGLPAPQTAYGVKVGNHSYKTDHDYINHGGSKTRWLQLGYDLERQQRYFPTAERRERTLRGAILLDETRGELGVTSDAGSDWRCSMEGRPGHAQYGIADFPGRWDNFGYGCVACMPQEDSAEGVLVLQPGDMVTSLFPQILDEQIRLTFEGGYVTEIEGGKRARQFQALLESYDHPESFGLSHWGYGTHESTELTGSGDIGNYHHNRIGSLLYSLGMNFGHGTGGKETGYSGSGDSTRKAPNHTHFAMFNCNSTVAGRQIIDRGHLAGFAGGLSG